MLTVPLFRGERQYGAGTSLSLLRSSVLDVFSHLLAYKQIDQGKRFVGPFEYLRVNADLSKEGILTEKSGENVKEMLWSSVSRWHKSALGESVISKLPRQQLS